MNKLLLYCIAQYKNEGEVLFFLQATLKLKYLGEARNILHRAGIEFPAYLNQDRKRGSLYIPIERIKKLQELSLSGIDMNVYKKPKSVYVKKLDDEKEESYGDP